MRKRRAGFKNLLRIGSLVSIVSVLWVLQGCILINPATEPTTLLISLWCPERQVDIYSLTFLTHTAPIVTLSQVDLSCPNIKSTFIGDAYFPYSELKSELSFPSLPTAVEIVYRSGKIGSSLSGRNSCRIPLEELPALVALPTPSSEGQPCGNPQEGTPLFLITKKLRSTGTIFSSSQREPLCDGSPCFERCDGDPCSEFPPRGTSLLTLTDVLKAEVDLRFLGLAIDVQEGYQIVSGAPS